MPGDKVRHSYRSVFRHVRRNGSGGGFRAVFRDRVVRAAPREDRTLAEPAGQYDAHPKADHRAEASRAGGDAELCGWNNQPDAPAAEGYQSRRGCADR